MVLLFIEHKEEMCQALTMQKQKWRLTRFKVVVDNGRSDLIEVLEGINDLHDDGAALFLWH